MAHKRMREALLLSFRFLKITGQIMRGLWKITMLPKPRVTIFGGHLMSLKDPLAQMAHDIAYTLIKENISVITGGGPGIMEAANCGAFHAQTKKIQARSIGVAVTNLEEREGMNLCVQEKIIVDSFFARKHLLINYSDAFAVFPGGFGTIDELAEIITLIQTKNLFKVQVVLIGTEYWQPFIDWCYDVLVKKGLVSFADVAQIKLTDDVQEALTYLRKHCDECRI